MPVLHLLGTGAALSGPERTTTMLAFSGEGTIVVDCGGDVIQRLLAAGLDLARIKLLILTHEHPDHVGGFPLLMEKLWLSGRRDPIRVCGPATALDQARRIFEAFDTSGWKGMPPIEWQEVPLAEAAPVWADTEWRIVASPGRHSVPVIGIRVEHVPSGASAAYSSDTERSEEFVRLARGADLLVHEATGALSGHISAAGAAEVARDAGARRLVLVHLPPHLDGAELDRAREIFPECVLGADGDRLEW